MHEISATPQRWVHEQIEVLGERAMNVTGGAWYTLFALATYEAAADFNDFPAIDPDVRDRKLLTLLDGVRAWKVGA